MSRAFQYKPKFVDIRVRPPREEEEDVHALKPGERRCENPGCLQTATAKAPKSREAAAFAATNGRAATDPLGIFRATKRRAEAEAARKLGRLERNALADLDLTEAATGPEIRTRYTELIKRCHPDSNGGDRSAENKLQRVLKAYKQLKQAKLV